MFFAGDQYHFNIGNHLLASQQLKLPAHGEQTSFKRDPIRRHHHHRPHPYHHHHHHNHQLHLRHHHHNAARCRWTASKWERWSQESTVTPSQVFLRPLTPSSPSLSQSLNPPSSHFQTPNPHHQLYFITQNLALRSKDIQSTFQSFFKMKHHLFLPVFWLI